MNTLDKYLMKKNVKSQVKKEAGVWGALGDGVRVGGSKPYLV